jgi:hypothetical protein
MKQWRKKTLRATLSQAVDVEALFGRQGNLCSDPKEDIARAVAPGNKVLHTARRMLKIQGPQRQSSEASARRAYGAVR